MSQAGVSACLPAPAKGAGEAQRLQRQDPPHFRSLPTRYARSPMPSRRLAATGALVLGGTMCLTVSAGAQSPAEERDSGGIWWSVSAAAAGARMTCDLPCDQSRDAGPSVEAALGTYASPSVRIGIDGGGWTFRDEDFREKIFTAGLVAEVHPRLGSGLHLIGGLGWTGYRANDIEPDPEDTGFSYDALRLRLGAGWDFRMASSWSVGSRITLDASSLGTLHHEGAPIATAVGLSVVRFAVFLRHR